MIGRPLVVILPSGGHSLPREQESRPGESDRAHWEYDQEEEERGKIKQRLGGVNIGSGKRETQRLGSGTFKCELGACLHS